jgi:hypothetical protein
MAMIFTEQENIDDVIFFPMMRPAISPLNAAIYGIEESAAAAVEDLALSIEDFRSLCEAGILKPRARNLIIKPHVRLWGAPSSAGGSRASGHAEMEGFLSNSQLRLAGWVLASDQHLPEEQQTGKILEMIEQSLVLPLRQKFPDCHLSVSPPTVMRG